MKQIGIILLLIFSFSFFFSCDIDSPYVDAVYLKIDKDNTPTDETPDSNPSPSTGSVAIVTNFIATALSYDPDTDTGIIRLTWDAPVAAGDQSEATRVIIRSYEAADPPDETSGTLVHDALPDEIQADFTGVALAESPHFGIWTMDADDRVSTGQFVNKSFVKSTVAVLYDCYTDSYMINAYHTATTLRVGGEMLSGQLISYLRFNNLPVSAGSILAADLNLRLSTAGSSFTNITLSRIDQVWDNTYNYSAIANLPISPIGSFTKGSTSSFTPWDVTSTMQNWSDSNHFGFRINENSGWDSADYFSQESSNDPFLELYHGSN